MRKLSILAALTFTFIMLISCTGNTPTSTPTADVVATIVAGTLTAFPSVTPTPSPTVTFTPEPPSVLPRSLYYEASDSNGKAQVYSLGRDGITITQITNEMEGVNYFAVSPVDGKVAYGTGLQLVLLDPNGASRHVITDIPDSLQHYHVNITFPHWSPDGQTIAYLNSAGVYFYNVKNEISTLVLENDDEDNLKYDSIGDFSPDNSKLIVGARHNKGIYDIQSGTVAFLYLPEFSKVVFGCSPAFWSPNAKYLYIAEWVNAGGPDCLRMPGLWRFNMDGTGITLIPGIDSNGRGISNAVSAPWQDTNGDLVYLFSPPDSQIYPPQVSLVRSASDGITNRVVLRQETFRISEEALWTPDGSALIIVQNNENASQYTNMILVPVDPSLPVVTLLADASSLGWYPLQWGQ